jgi:hypothetical protein
MHRGFYRSLWKLTGKIIEKTEVDNQKAQIMQFPLHARLCYLTVKEKTKESSILGYP